MGGKVVTTLFVHSFHSNKWKVTTLLLQAPTKSATKKFHRDNRIIILKQKLSIEDKFWKISNSVQIFSIKKEMLLIGKIA